MSNAPPFTEAMNAARLGHSKKLRAILSQRPELFDGLDASAERILFACAKAPGKSAADCAKAALAAGADIHARNGDGESAVTRAAAEGSIQLLALLLAAGGDPNARQEGGPSSAMWAAKRPDGAAFLEMLAAAGADFTLLDGAGASAASWAHCHWREANKALCEARSKSQEEAREIAGACAPANASFPKPRI